MSLRFLAITGAVPDLLFGLALLLFPAPVISLFGPVLSADGVLMARYFGSTLLASAALIWYVQQINAPRVQRPLLAGYAVSNLAGLVVTLGGVISGQLNVLGWASSLLYLHLSLWSAVFAIRGIPLK